MSIHSPDTNGHLTITAPSAGGITQGAKTVAILYKNIAFAGSQIWYAYDASNFSQLNLYFDGDMWESFLQWDVSVDISSSIWWWLVISRGASPGAVRGHIAPYSSSGAMSWTHGNFPGSRGNYNATNRLCLGDEFGSGFRGDAAVLTAFTSEMNDAAVEATFVRSSVDILAASPQFFVHFPEAAGVGDPFSDIAGGGIEIIHTGDWTATADPPGYVFSLGRSGKPKVWNGTDWAEHPAKVWDGTSWNVHPVKGYNGTEFIASK